MGRQVPDPTVLARQPLPEKYIAWNRAHGAPAGRGMPGWGGVLNRLPERIRYSLMGCYAMQVNSDTRAFEYPWAYFASPLRPGMDVLEIGGGLSGFQFTLSGAGCRVTNVDPGEKATGGASFCDAAAVARFNRLFGTDVTLLNTTIDEAGLSREGFDRAFAISVLEHLPQEEMEAVMREVFRVLRPGGTFVITLDLFLNLRPFTSRTANHYGRNIDVATLCAIAPFRLAVGNRSELFGFPEFEPERILSELEQFVMGTAYPVLSQCLVLEKPAGPA